MQEWEALPQRKRNRRENDHKATSPSLPSSSSSPSTEHSHRRIPKNLNLINQAISERAHANRAVATLNSGDGCAGENFECFLCP